VSPAGPYPHRMSVDLPAAHRGVRVARNVLRRFARMQGLAPGDIDELLLVASELLANAIDHGGGGAALTEEELPAEIRMRLGFTITPHEWQLEVTDEGGGNVDEVRALVDPQGLPDLEDDRGRGLFLMAQTVDHLGVVAGPDGKGLTFQVRKRLAVS